MRNPNPFRPELRGPAYFEDPREAARPIVLLAVQSDPLAALFGSPHPWQRLRVAFVDPEPRSYFAQPPPAIERPMEVQAEFDDQPRPLQRHEARSHRAAPECPTDRHRPGRRGQLASRRRPHAGSEDEVEPDAPPRQAVVPVALLDGAGKWCVLPFGEFRPLLAAQLAHPERIGDQHKIPCYVQVYESQRPMPLAVVARMVLGDASRACELRPLRSALAARLKLDELMPSPASPEAARFLRLTVAHDPTVASECTHPPQAGAGSFDEQTRMNHIPERFQKPWEFRSSREEALYDINRQTRRGGFFSALLARWARWRKSEEFDKWRALLEGKPPDEQLWGVRPPLVALSDPQVREWIRQVLVVAGYNPEAMMTEWEIFWRRKAG